jgi:nucleoside-diphosphate-sugar epimerase
VKVLVTGGTGCVGSHTAAALAERGHAVRLLVRNPARVPTALGPHGIDESVETVVGDVTDADAVGCALDGCESVIHAAAIVALDRRRDAEIAHTNVRATELVLQTAHKLELDPIVHVSSVAALLPASRPVLGPDDEIGRAVGSYARSKVDAERVARALQDDGAPVVITYPGGVWGPHDPTQGEQLMTIVNFLKAGVIPASTSGGMPVVDARDLGAVHAACIESGRGPRRYMAGGELLSTSRLVDILRTITGRRLVRVPLSASVMIAIGTISDLVQRVSPVTLPLTHEAMVTLTSGVPCDNTRTNEELSVEFRPVAETLTDTIRWLYETGGLSARHVGTLAR